MGGKHIGSNAEVPRASGYYKLAVLCYEPMGRLLNSQFAWRNRYVKRNKICMQTDLRHGC